jgi:hypothetical protein
VEPALSATWVFAPARISSCGVDSSSVSGRNYRLERMLHAVEYDLESFSFQDQHQLLGCVTLGHDSEQFHGGR